MKSLAYQHNDKTELQIGFHQLFHNSVCPIDIKFAVDYEKLNNIMKSLIIVHRWMFDQQRPNQDSQILSMYYPRDETKDKETTSHYYSSSSIPQNVYE